MSIHLKEIKIISLLLFCIYLFVPNGFVLTEAKKNNAESPFLYSSIHQLTWGRLNLLASRYLLTDLFQCAQDKDQRSMDIETARIMLQLLLGRLWPLHSEFARFLDQSKYKVINKDQWCNILEFSRTITHDLVNYDIDGACEQSRYQSLQYTDINFNVITLF